MAAREHPFQPCAEQAALIPALSGNAVNGLGEAEKRRPSPVYWHSPRDIAHGRQQTWMLRHTQKHVPQVHDMNAQLGGRGAKDRQPKSPTPRSGTAADFAREAKAFALANEADLVGIARMQPEWAFEGHDIDLPWIVVVALEMDHGELAKAPEPPSVIEVMRQYNRGTRAARGLADWILDQGYRAVPHGGPQAGPVIMIPAAIQCGLGELGKHGSIINPRYGSSFRLACVLTDMPLVADAPISFGVDDFCTHCKVCRDACPPDAIFADKQLVRGEIKWYVDFDACVTYFNETYGCGICIAVCPWSLPGVAPRLADKMSRRAAREVST